METTFKQKSCPVVEFSDGSQCWRLRFYYFSSKKGSKPTYSGYASRKNQRIFDSNENEGISGSAFTLQEDAETVMLLP